MIENIDFGKGIVVYNELLINKDEPLEHQIWDLKEDLLQVQYNDGELILDVGWYPEFNVNGVFKVQVIKNQDWENPLFIEEVSIHSLKSTLVKIAFMLKM